MISVLSKRVSSLDDYLDPAGVGWNSTAVSVVEMVPAPLGLQPNDYIVAAWEDRDYGNLDFVEVHAVHDGKKLATRLRWKKIRPDTGAQEGFPDAAAIAFPLDLTPDITSMGTSERPIHMLQWVARKNVIRPVAAKGIGSSVPGDTVGEAISAGWSQGFWNVVFVRNLDGAKGAPSLAPGGQSQLGFAVWDGTNEERAGIKAVSADWTELKLEP